MPQLRAFVGHSFTDDDQSVVAQFLKFFDQLKASALDFNWTHAESAEPKELSTKVQSLLVGKNLFIGICTAKELAIPQASVRPLVFDHNKVAAAKWEFELKTSDWIIQEIGLAIGHGFDLILLLEDGVRRPGGLQGNIEYIPFSRETPSDSFGRILEMLTALAGAPARQTTTSLESRAEDVQDESPAPALSFIDELAQPNPDWPEERFEIAFFHFTMVDEPAKAEKISEAYLGRNGISDEKRTSWAAYEEQT